jgi:tetratricopeptide (TPR) repeat protein
LTLQQHIAGRLMRVLTIGLSPRERERLAKDPTQSFRAYREYLEAQRTIEASGDEGGAEPAIALYREAIRVDPGFALAYAGLSEALWLKGASEGKPEAMVEAEEAARKALELDPELPAAKVALARTRRHKGEYGASIAELKTVLADHPHPDEAQRELAYSYERAGDLEAAENALRAAVAVGGDNWLNWNELGSFLWEAGRYGEAKAAFVKAAALSPEGVTKAEENVAAVEVSQGHFDQAVRTYEQIAQPIRSAILASNIGTAYYFSDRPDKWRQAERYYSLAVRLNPRDDRIQRNLADLFAHLGRIHEASEHYRDALSVIEAKLQGDPANTDLRLRRALYAAKAGNCGEAVGWAEELGRQLPDTAENALHLAQIYGTCGERSGALRWIGKAAELGVPPKLLEEQDEFDSLRDDPAFTKLVSRRSEGRAGAPPP